ncbi:MAG: copper transporter, partial [Actinobacteria bacterium]|nr:copper transporter [Actinomycetota bacterium]
MINFRYHLVSLTAVFLALAIGIAMGATVVDQATVKLLRSQLESV